MPHGSVSPISRAKLVVATLHFQSLHPWQQLNSTSVHINTPLLDEHPYISYYNHRPTT
ncbi:hypothetical protein CY34DRAFT_809517 [Suillus luteus UH-Slu-Lm8-n1]|uniref:Uncharacterized protein n=1 Tax=Suillus luteus UH-Slu-Lm8-n1 TaxID=930992 RepID=A0A0C9ZL91_9AGAM|nr:hypothetical protein CY34DRAFT_809517 [Suillus luteus UH-Slu-Lm8-n1]